MSQGLSEVWFWLVVAVGVLVHLVPLVLVGVAWVRQLRRREWGRAALSWVLLCGLAAGGWVLLDAVFRGGAGVEFGLWIVAVGTGLVGAAVLAVAAGMVWGAAKGVGAVVRWAWGKGRGGHS